MPAQIRGVALHSLKLERRPSCDAEDLKNVGQLRLQAEQTETELLHGLENAFCEGQGHMSPLALSMGTGAAHLGMCTPRVKGRLLFTFRYYP